MIDPYVSHFSPGVVVFSIIVFMLFKQSQIKYAPKIISRISKNSLYIYMIHRIIVIVVTKILDSAVENELLKIVMAFIMTFILSWLIAEIWIEIRDTLNQRYQIKQRISDYLCNKYSLQ